MTIFVLAVVFVLVYWLSAALLGPSIARLRWSRFVLRLLGYLFSFAGILLLMWWGYAPAPQSGFNWVRWIPWALGPVAFGASTALLADVKRRTAVAAAIREVA